MQATRSGSAQAPEELPLAIMRAGRCLKGLMTRTHEEAWALLLLHNLCERDGCRLSELGRSVGLDTSTVSRHVAQLADAGYLTRSVDPQDGRAQRLRITRKGRRLLANAKRARAAALSDALADWTDADKRTLTTLTTRLADALDQRRRGTETEAET